MLLKRQINTNTNTNENEFLLPKKCVKRVLKYSNLVLIILNFLSMFVSFTTISCYFSILLAIAQTLIALAQTLLALAQTLLALPHFTLIEIIQPLQFKTLFLLQNYKLPKTKRKSVQSIKPKTKIDRDNIFPLSTILFTLKNHFLFFFFFYLGVTRGNWTTCKHLARPRLQHTNHWGQYSPISVFNIVFNFPPKFHNFNVFFAQVCNQ